MLYIWVHFLVIAQHTNLNKQSISCQRKIQIDDQRVFISKEETTNKLRTPVWVSNFLKSKYIFVCGRGGSKLERIKMTSGQLKQSRGHGVRATRESLLHLFRLVSLSRTSGPVLLYSALSLSLIACCHPGAMITWS